MADFPTLYYRHAGRVYQITLSPHGVDVEQRATDGTLTAKSLKFGDIRGLRNGKSWNESLIEKLIIRCDRQIAAAPRTGDRGRETRTPDRDRSARSAITLT